MAEDVFGIVGSVIAGAYHVEAVVAEGGFGVVYRAHHGGFRAPVALKLLKVPPQSSEQQAAFLELFRAEAELLFRLSASLPTVVRPLHVDAFTAFDGSFVPYIVLEWLEGVTLDALIKQRNRDGLAALPLRKLVRLLTPVARALERAHNFSGPEGVVSIVHRDLKPENIFVAQVAGEEVVKILDFGIGKVKSAASQVAGRMSQDGHAPTAFTPAYGAPEQWAPKHFGQTGPWTDVWGLALCMVEALAARPVIDGDPAAMMGTTLDPLRRPTPRTEGVELPDAVEAVFARALALDPRARPRDAGVFWNELVAALQVPDSERGIALQRDPRAEDGGAGVRVERVEVRSRSSGSMARVPQPSAAVEQALAMDLEFDPSQPARLGAVSETRPSTPAPARMPVPVTAASHFVPDLEIAPPSVPRRPSGAQAAVVQRPSPQSSGGRSDAHSSGAHTAVIDFDDGAQGGSLDLDLPEDEPLARRSASSPGMRAVQTTATRHSSPPPRSLSPAPTSVRNAPPPVSGVIAVSTEVQGSTAGAQAAPSPHSAGGPPRRSVPPLAPQNASALDTGFVAKIEPAVLEVRPLMRRLRPALALLGVSISIAIFDPIYASLTGEVLEVFGVRPSVFGALILLLAFTLAGREVLREA
ncbi:MAG TPA: protein kinase [Polyangiaceae bacterium]|jgi:serine/threonine protein kinase|nr:protein kinase [Polyangiaceae bacterium]